jgi:hypothetical protein
MSVDTKTLTSARLWLVKRMHQICYGTMHGLVVRDGEPVSEPPPKTKQAFKLGSKRNPPKVVSRTFVLKQQHLDLFELLDSKQNGVIAKLTIQDGLPFFVEWEVD